MDQVCLSGVEAYATYFTMFVTALSVIANFVPKESTAGKIVNWLALNFKAPKK